MYNVISGYEFLRIISRAEEDKIKPYPRFPLNKSYVKGEVKLQTLLGVGFFNHPVTVGELLEESTTLTGKIRRLDDSRLSMRLLRYTRQGLLRRERYRKMYYYNLTNKGKKRIDFLKKKFPSLQVASKPESVRASVSIEPLTTCVGFQNMFKNIDMDDPKNLLDIIKMLEMNRGENLDAIPMFCADLKRCEDPILFKKRIIELMLLRGYLAVIPTKESFVLEEAIENRPLSHIALELALYKIDELQRVVQGQ